MIIRNVTPEDIKAVLSIYRPYITDTNISFEMEVPTLEDFEKRVEVIKKQYPFIVCEDNGKVVGYAYASKHRERAAYRYSVDVSIYVDLKHHGKGIGTLLYIKLFELLQSYNIFTAYAGITLPNEKSLALHKKFDFHEIGTYHNVGYKNEIWLDVIWLEKKLKEYQTPLE